jgi:hypothetical protein
MGIMLTTTTIATHRAFRFSSVEGASMARNRILRKDGTTTRYFWTDADNAAPEKTVYKETTEGVKRMKGVHFDATTNRIVKH